MLECHQRLSVELFNLSMIVTIQMMLTLVGREYIELNTNSLLGVPAQARLPDHAKLPARRAWGPGASQRLVCGFAVLLYQMRTRFG